MHSNLSLSISEQIDRAKASEGRNQTWIIKKMIENGIEMTDVKFSRKKLATYPNDNFSDEELAILSNILHTNLTK